MNVALISLCLILVLLFCLALLLLNLEKQSSDNLLKRNLELREAIKELERFPIIIKVNGNRVILGWANSEKIQNFIENEIKDKELELIQVISENNSQISLDI